MKKFKIVLTLIILLLMFIFSNYLRNNTNIYDSNNTILKVHYIDVGQGDSILIQINDKNLLIDAGPEYSESNLISYLKNLKIKKLDYVVATHPHEDHIGGMDEIIRNFNINKFYAPYVTNTSKNFENMIKELKNKDIKINVIRNDIGKDFDLGLNTLVEFFSPIEDSYENINNYSPVIKISYGNTSFLFTGDAEEEIESVLLITKHNYLKSNVLKLGHHGSSTSTTEDFIKAVSPKIAVISVGYNNKYGHPNIDKLKLLSTYKIPYFRTDEDGTIIIYSDGKNLKLSS